MRAALLTVFTGVLSCALFLPLPGIADPATHEPVRNIVASVSVLAPSGAEADALATALMVMGPEKGIAFAEAAQLPVLFLMHDGDGSLREAASSTFAAHRIG